MDWEYFQITPWLPHVQVDAGDGLFEVVVTVCGFIGVRDCI